MYADDALKRAWESWVRAALNLLSQQPLAVSSKPTIVINDDRASGSFGWHTGESQLQFDAQSFLFRNAALLSGLPEEASLVDAIQRNHGAHARLMVLSHENEVPQGFSHLYGNYLSPFLEEMLVAGDGTTFSDATFQWLYESLIQLIEQPESILLHAEMSFTSLVLETEQFSVAPDLIVRTPSAAEQARSVLERMRLSMFGVGSFFMSRATAEYTRLLHPENDIPNLTTFTNHASIVAMRLEFAFRLVDVEPITHLETRITSSNPFIARNAFPRPTVSALTGGLIRPGYNYRLTKEIADRLQEAWATVQVELDDPRYQLARQRLMDSYLRLTSADRHLDYWIALESLFVPDGKHGDLTYRAAMRIAQSIGKTFEERLDIASKVKASYNVRSAIAHGAVDRNKELRRLSESEQWTGEVLRQSLLKCLRAREAPDITALDAQLLGKGNSPA